MLDNTIFYVVDIDGVKTLRERHHGKLFFVIYLDAFPEIVTQHVCKHGDSENKITKRLANDSVMFADLEGLKSDVIIYDNRPF